MSRRRLLLAFLTASAVFLTTTCTASSSFNWQEHPAPLSPDLVSQQNGNDYAPFAAQLPDTVPANTTHKKRDNGAWAWPSTPFSGPGVPIFVRSPYTSTYLWAGNHDRGSDLTQQWLGFWNGYPVPLCINIRVDNTIYTVSGITGLCAPSGGNRGTIVSMSFTSTATTYVYAAGPLRVTMVFLSPITPNDLVRQTLPYAYYNVSVTATDSQAHNVQIYTDITGSWASNDNSRQISWNTASFSGLHVHNISLTNQVPYGEDSADQSLYGSAVLATDSSANTTWSQGSSSAVRSAWASSGTLSGSTDTAYRAINNNEPVFAFSKNVGTLSAGATASALFAIGHYRDPALLFTATNDPTPSRSSYFMSAYPSLQSSLSFFYSDYANALSMSQNFDAQIQSAATSVYSAHYADICALISRQVWSGTEVFVPQLPAGGYDTSMAELYQKEIATSNDISTVDVLAPSIPYFLYLNPDLLKYAMRPIIQYAEEVFPYKWAPHDIGYPYPNAGGARQLDAPYYIEESGNMLYMALGYTRFSGKTDVINDHYSILKQWADYLVTDSLYPVLQASTDDFSGELANMTSLAVKGAVGIGCMGQIATLLGRTDDARRYNSTAVSYAQQIIRLAQSSNGDHLRLTYQSDDSTWSSQYNMWPDRLFGLGIFPASVYSSQASWYARQAQTYGVQLDSRSNWVKADWAFWLAATHSDNRAVSDLFVEGYWKFLDYGSLGQAANDRYDVTNAGTSGFNDRPVIGAIYALLAQAKLATLPLPSGNGNAAGTTVVLTVSAPASTVTLTGTVSTCSSAPVFTPAPTFTSNSVFAPTKATSKATTVTTTLRTTLTSTTTLRTTSVVTTTVTSIKTVTSSAKTIFQPH